MLIQLVKTFIFNHCDKHVNCLHAWRSKPRCYFSDKLWMRRSLQGGPVRVFMHRQCRPWSKLTWKHVMFQWQPSIDINRSKMTCHEAWVSKLEPWHLPPTKTCQVLAGSLTHVSMPGQPNPPRHIPIETWYISIVMFQPHAPIFHVPPCNPHPWHFRPFSTSHCCCVCFLLNSNVFITTPPPNIYLGFR